MTENTIATHNMSEGTTNGALNLFKVPKTDISTVAYRMVTIQPTTTGINPMEFCHSWVGWFYRFGKELLHHGIGIEKRQWGKFGCC